MIGQVHERISHIVNFTSSEILLCVSGPATSPVQSSRMKFRLKELRDRKGLTQEQMAELLDISVSLYNGLENGKRRMNADYIEGAAAIFGIPAPLLIDVPATPIAVAGCVGAGAQVPLVDATEHGDALFHIAAPEPLLRNGPPKDIAAVEIKGDSMSPMYQPGDVLFYTRHTHEGIPEEDIGRPCIVEDANGMAWVKQVKRGDSQGLWNLISLNPTAETMHNVRIKWAARVMLALPAEMVERL
ncbi:LexA family transcriptional regulator [Paracoccus aminophilus]|uniref:HTH cro/C1-type domain-containing protein n=1 Tax=Paracoccus aminophilus JCM 7686 TaxID=1367847 RepID=S5Y079_PARAH|nr:helix-turn-helix domain-containing protein [Paracoccus aminophilus]AGT09105.1 hypothetical protein JCM7686_2024 [Paracoccus aminophilus JCM 7686]